MHHPDPIDAWIDLVGSNGNGECDPIPYAYGSPTSQAPAPRARQHAFKYRYHRIPWFSGRTVDGNTHSDLHDSESRDGNRVAATEIASPSLQDDLGS